MALLTKNRREERWEGRWKKILVRQCIYGWFMMSSRKSFYRGCEIRPRPSVSVDRPHPRWRNSRMSGEYAVLAPPTAQGSHALAIGPAGVVRSCRPVGCCCF